MYYEEDKGTRQFLSGLAVGALLGAGIALLFAPESGTRTRHKMITQVVSGRQQLEDRMQDLASDAGRLMRRRRRRKRRLI